MDPKKFRSKEKFQKIFGLKWFWLGTSFGSEKHGLSSIESQPKKVFVVVVVVVVVVIIIVGQKT